MTKIIYDINLMRFMSLFETLTGARVKDCIDANNQLIFVVHEGQMGKAAGKRGANVKRIELAIKRKIKIVEYAPEVVAFVKNLVTPLRVKEAVEDEGVITLTAEDSQTRGMLIGRNATNLRSFEAVTKRYFPIKEIKVK